MVSEIITRELTSEQVALLNDLLEHSTNFHVSGIEVVIARTTAQEYVPDFAVVAHKLMDMENIQVLFALAQMEDRVFVVGRSRLSEVDVAEILAELGGGGHSYAASAAIKDQLWPRWRKSCASSCKNGSTRGAGPGRSCPSR